VTQVAGEYGFMRVLVLNADGSQANRIGPDSGGLDAIAPVVPPDGRRIAYAVTGPADGDHWRIHVRSIDGTGTDLATDHEFVGGAASIRWLPDGKLLIVNHHYFPGTWLVDAGDGSVRQASWTDPGYTSFQRLAE